MAVWGPTNITAEADDGEDTIGGSWDDRTGSYTAHTKIRMVRSGTDRDAGLRWTGITIPQGATVSAADIVFGLPDGDPGTSFDVFVHGDDVDDAPALSNTSKPSSGWTNTTATSTISAGSGMSTTISVTSIVQELVDRASWTSGNAMRFAFRIDDVETYDNITIEDYNASPAGTGASLEITYTAAGGATALPFRMHY